MRGDWPDGPAALTDFGIDSKEHFEALCMPVRNGEITAEDLEEWLQKVKAALRRGPKGRDDLIKPFLIDPEKFTPPSDAK